MTDTRILEGMMEAFRRNPMIPDRMKYPERQFVETDEAPFYDRSEVEVGTHPTNRRFAEIADLFHQDISGPRLERPRRGTCGAVSEQVIEGRVWRSEECGGEVQAVETRIPGAVRVDGKCLKCGWELHRAGLLTDQ